MKRTLFISIIIGGLGCMFLSCNKKEIEPLGPEWGCELFQQMNWGHSSALTNYLDWDVFVQMGVEHNGKISLYFKKIPDTVSSCEFVETLNIFNLPVSTGVVELQYTTVADRLKPHVIPTAEYVTHAGGFDTTSEQYNLMENGEESNVTVNYIAPDTSEIRGTYNLYFVHDTTMPSKSDPNRPDTLHFLQGSYRALRIQ